MINKCKNVLSGKIQNIRLFGVNLPLQQAGGTSIRIPCCLTKK